MKTIKTNSEAVNEVADLLQTIIVAINDGSIISNNKDYWQMVEDWRNKNKTL